MVLKQSHHCPISIPGKGHIKYNQKLNNESGHLIDNTVLFLMIASFILQKNGNEFICSVQTWVVVVSFPQVQRVL